MEEIIVAALAFAVFTYVRRFMKSDDYFDIQDTLRERRERRERRWATEKPATEPAHAEPASSVQAQPEPQPSPGSIPGTETT